MLSAEQSPLYSVALVMDPAVGVPPDKMGGASIAVGLSSVAIGTLSESDGTPRFFLGNVSDGPPARDLVLRWDGAIETSGRIALATVEDEILLATDADKYVAVQIWTDDESEPDAIWVALRHGLANESPVSDRA